MRPPLATLALQMAALLVGACAVAWTFNHFASATRRLEGSRPVVAPQLQPRPVPVAPEGVPPHTPGAKAIQPPRNLAKPQPMVADAGPNQREISSQEALELFDKGVPFLDARRSADYLEGHIRGAWRLPVWEAELDERLTRFDATGLPLKSPVVLYCSGGDCQDSHLLASRLMALGYRNLLIYRDGYPDWVAKGRSTAQGEQP